MKHCLGLAVALALSACQLQPLYSGGSGGQVATTLSAVTVTPIEGQVGWLVYNKLRDRLGAAGTSAVRYRLEVQLDDDIIGLGIRGDRAVTRERRTLRARYQLVDVSNGAGRPRRHCGIGRGDRRGQLGICDGCG